MGDIKVASKPRGKMPVSERAKQFMPFAALKGLPEALAEKEKIRVPKIVLSDDMAVELDRKMHCLERRKKATVVYYFQEEYFKITGLVSRIDKTFRILQIVNTTIPFDDIVDIESMEDEMPEG